MISIADRGFRYFNISAMPSLRDALLLSFISLEI